MSEQVCEVYEFDGTWHAGEMREEVVRCRDCKHYEPEGGYEEHVEACYPPMMVVEPPSCGNPKLCDTVWDELTEEWVPLRVLMPEPNGFCAWGERKVGE